MRFSKLAVTQCPQCNSKGSLRKILWGMLQKVGRDSVIVIKDRTSSHLKYEIRFAELGRYEEFIDEFATA